MIEMDGRDSTKCQKSKLRNIIDIIEMCNDNKYKTTNSDVSYLKRPKEKTKREGDAVGCWKWSF